MSTTANQTLEETAKRNPAVMPDRVREMQEVVKKLQERGVLQPSRYAIQPALGGAKSSLAGAQGTKMMNRVGGG
ncbi:MAG: hypothetical protein JSR77_01700 [Planctomycetes bacterium]|nr:hypothetical protein [Planctomycetota bacterium]